MFPGLGALTGAPLTRRFFSGSGRIFRKFRFVPKKKAERRGRPKFKPTQEMRERVAIGAAGGMTHEQLAIALGIARETLEKNFEVELSIHAQQRRLDVLMAMHTSAMGNPALGMKPNVAAQKAFVAASIALLV